MDLIGFALGVVIGCLLLWFVILPWMDRKGQL